MKFKKLVSGVEIPEKSDSSHWINVRANERIDVCMGNVLSVSTGIHITVAKNETVWLRGVNVPLTRVVCTGELLVPIYNKDARNIMIYPGQVIAEILVEKAPVKASTRKRKTAKFTSSAKVVKSENK